MLLVTRQIAEVLASLYKNSAGVPDLRRYHVLQQSHGYEIQVTRARPDIELGIMSSALIHRKVNKVVYRKVNNKVVWFPFQEVCESGGSCDQGSNIPRDCAKPSNI